MADKQRGWRKSRSFLESFWHALHGFEVAWRKESNLKRQFTVGALVLLAAFFLNVAVWKFIVLVLSCALVVCLELMNTAVEILGDAMQIKYNARIRAAKDVAAAAVLAASAASVVVGLVILGPALWEFFL